MKTALIHSFKALGTTAMTAIRRHRRGMGALLSSTLLTAGCSVGVKPPEVSVTYPPPFVAGPILTFGPPAVYPLAPIPPVMVQAPATQDPRIAELQPVVAPIALYPDPLLAVMLPASTYPQQLINAQQWLASNPGGAPLIDSQNWDPSVKAVAHYPTVLQQLTADPQWTESLGSAFASEPRTVSDAIQDLRAKAMAAGSLVSSPQMEVVQDGQMIAIQPAMETVISVPVYDPLAVYSGAATLTFESGLVVGPWLVNGYDWDGGAIFVGDWHGPYVFEHGRWARDRYWDRGRFHSWQHDERFGAAPARDRRDYVASREIRSHSEQFKAGMTRASTAQRYSRDASAHNYYGSNNSRPRTASTSTPRPMNMSQSPTQKIARSSEPNTGEPGGSSHAPERNGK